MRSLLAKSGRWRGFDHGIADRGRHPVRLLFRDLDGPAAAAPPDRRGRARRPCPRLFHQQREWLEARFISALGQTDPVEGQRWEAAQWHDEVLWRRDRQKPAPARLGLRPLRARAVRAVPVQRHATALFEFRKGRWCAEGKSLDEMRPDEAVGRNQRFEAVFVLSTAARRRLSGCRQSNIPFGRCECGVRRSARWISGKNAWK